MPDAHPTINTLVSALADDASVDWDAAERAAGRGTSQELVRQFKIISAMGTDRRDTAGTGSRAWPRALTAAWAAVVAVAAAKVVVAMWGMWAVVVAGGPSTRWPFTVTMVLFGVSGMLLIVGGSKDRRGRSLGALYVMIAAAFGNRLMPPVDTGLMGACISELRRLPVDAFLPLALWLFVRAFPREPTDPLARRVADGFVVGAAYIGGLLFAVNAWLAHDRGDTIPPAIAAVLGVLDRDAHALVYWPLLFTVAGIAIPYAIWRLRFERVDERQRGTLFITAFIVGITPMLLAVMITPFVPILRHPDYRRPIAWVLYGALMSVVPFTVYTVVVQRVMDVRFILRRTIQHAFARYAIWLVSVGPLAYLFLDIYRQRGLPAAEIQVHAQPTGLLVLTLAGAVVLMFRERLLRVVDGWFFRGAVDYAEARARVEQGLRSARSIVEIARLLTRAIDRAMHPTRVVVFAVDDAGARLIAVDGTSQPLSTESVLVEVLRRVRGDVHLEPDGDGRIARLLPEVDRQWLHAERFTLMCPLMDSTGRLLGMIALGESRGGLPYAKQDRLFIRSVCDHAAIQIENRWLREFAADDRDRPQPSAPGATVNWDKEPGAQCPQCGVVWPGNIEICSCHTRTVPAALPIVVKGKFRVERLIGAGGMGVVYLAVDETLDRKVAIKTLPNMTPNRAAWLQREARTMAAVVHPNLALIFGAEQWRGTPLLIVEYLEGGTLSEYLRRGPLDVDEAIDLGIVLADVLDRVHAAGVLHRDIKPSNIAYTGDGIPKLLDFGVAAILDRSRAENEPLPISTLTSTSTADSTGGSQPLLSVASSTRVVGTPLYLSPEALAGELPQSSFDLWSLGLVLYEALAGCHPFSDESVARVIARIRETRVPDVRDFRGDCPPELSALLRDSLSPRLSRRPSTAGELRARLQRLRAAQQRESALNVPRPLETRRFFPERVRPVQPRQGDERLGLADYRPQPVSERDLRPRQRAVPAAEPAESSRLTPPAGW